MEMPYTQGITCSLYVSPEDGLCGCLGRQRRGDCPSWRSTGNSAFRIGCSSATLSRTGQDDRKSDEVEAEFLPKQQSLVSEKKMKRIVPSPADAFGAGLTHSLAHPGRHTARPVNRCCWRQTARAIRSHYNRLVRPWKVDSQGLQE